MKIAYLALAAVLHGFKHKPLVSASPDIPTRNGQPEEIRSVNGLLEVTLNVDLFTTTELGRTAPGYNNGPVGPTLRAKPGDQVRIKLVNNLKPSPAEELELSSFAMNPVADNEAKEVNQTLIVNRLQYPTGNLYLPREKYWGKSFQNLHFHGVMVDPTIDDSRVYIDGGGKEMMYEFDIPDDSPRLFGFYHNHVHGTGTYSFLSGLYGFFVVEDDATHQVPSYIAATPQSSEHFLLLSESKTHDDGVPQDYIGIAMDFDWAHVTNGQLSPTFTFKKGEHIYFRAVNAGVEPAMYLSIENHKLTPYAMDGYPMPKATEVDELTLDAGVRSEFLVKFNTPGTFKFKRGPWNAGVQGDLCMDLLQIEAETCISFDKEELIATIVVLEEEIETIEMLDISTALDAAKEVRSSTSQPAMDPYLESLLELPNAGSRVITFDQAHGFPIFQIPYDGEFVPPGAGFGVNNLLFNPHYFHGDIKGGTCEDWTVKAVNTVPIHSFHTHSVPFYVTSMDGIALDDKDRFWRDTIVTGSNITATVCFPEREVESYLNVHCHMPQHQDVGMAAFYKLLPGGTDDVGSGSSTGGSEDVESDPSTEVEKSEPTKEEDPNPGKRLKSSLSMYAVASFITWMFY